MGAVDHHGNPLSTDPATAASWSEFSVRFQRQRSGADEALREVMAADPDFAVARAMAGVMGASLGNPDLDGAAQIDAALNGTAEHEWERSFVGAAASAVAAGPLWGSANEWFAHHDTCPTDVNGLVFAVIGASTSTDSAKRDEIRRRVERTHDEVGDDPTVLGFRGMSAQERGELDAAERFATRALELDPTGSDGAHPMAHVYFERGDHVGGAAWLDAWLPTADQESDFTTHLHWHAELHHLALGDIDHVLEAYTDRLCGGGPRALPDRASMLWRLQLHGVVDEGADPSDVPMSEVLEGRLDGVPFAFAAANVALGLAASGDAGALRRFAEIAATSETPGATRLIGPIALALADRVTGDFDSAADRLIAIDADMANLGGSHAQREVFDDTLIDSLVCAGRTEEAHARLRERLERRPSRLDEQWMIR